MQNPPSFDQLGQLGLDTKTIIEGSADSFDAGGFKYDPTQNIPHLLTKIDRDDLANNFPPITNLPVCNLDHGYGWTSQTHDFANALTKPGETSQGTVDTLPPFCYCIGVQDQFGNRFEDAIDLGKWIGQWCPRDMRNVRGGQPLPGIGEGLPDGSHKGPPSKDPPGGLPGSQGPHIG